MSTPSFDYAIVGAGAAGLHLAIKLAKDKAFEKKNILIIEPDAKNTNDRTWSFWENDNSWDHLVIKKWNKSLFYSSKEKFEIPLQDYWYKTIRSSDFYAYAKKQIHHSGRFEWVIDKITGITEKEIKGEKSTYQANHIFDSRLPKNLKIQDPKYPSLVQHFLGWFIETDEPHFNDVEITVMDYRVKWKNHTSFHYVLPFSSNYALVEFTLFDEQVLEENEYEEKLKTYIEETLGIKQYNILEKEIGQIPMTTYPFHQHHEKNLTKIGTAGGWVRPSTGYSFKNGDRYSGMIIKNLKEGKPPHRGIANNRFRWYDRIFNGVLQERNDLGEFIFQKLYTKHSSKLLNRFLDEESDFVEDLQIMASMNKPIFPKHFFKTLLHS